MKEEHTTKSPATEISGDIARKLNVLLTEIDNESEVSQEIDMKEELIEEMMQDLYKEISSPSSTSTSSLSSSSSSNLPLSFPSPSSSLLLSLQFDVKSESCGASVSDTTSTVMAGVEFEGHAGIFVGGKVESPENETWVVEVERGCDDGECKMKGCDGGEVGDEWLARVLSWGPLELEEWT